MKKKNPKHTITNWMKNIPEILSFINLDKYLSVEPQDSDSSKSR